MRHHIKKVGYYITEKSDRTALDDLKREILTLLRKLKKKIHISKFSTSSTPDILCFLIYNAQTLESEINFLKSELQEKEWLYRISDNFSFVALKRSCSS